MERLSTEDYFREALAILGEQGSEGLTIAALCERLDVTKGSFYHHFGGLPGFVEQLLAHWERGHGARLHAVSRAEPEPALRIPLLTEVSVNLPHADEAAMRAWGRSNPEVAQACLRVDRRRERYLVDAIAALGVDRLRARLLAHIAQSMLIGVQQREQPVDVRRLRQMCEEIDALILLEAG